MDDPKPETPVIDASSREVWVTFTINGQPFEAELFDELEFIGHIERRMKDSANECHDCGALLPAAIPEGSSGKLLCGNCGGTDVTISHALLSEIAKELRLRHGLKRCGPTAAADFYGAIFNVLEESKKKNTQPAELLTGTESTPADGETIAAESG